MSAFSSWMISLAFSWSFQNVGALHLGIELVAAGLLVAQVKESLEAGGSGRSRSSRSVSARRPRQDSSFAFVFRLTLLNRTPHCDEQGGETHLLDLTSLLEPNLPSLARRTGFGRWLIGVRIGMPVRRVASARTLLLHIRFGCSPESHRSHMKSARAMKRLNARKPFQFARLESLESRCLLNAKLPAQITIQEIPSTLVSGTSELLITGTKNNDGITINDNGTGTAGNMFVSLSDGRDFMSTGAVTAVDVVTGTGNDRVTYELDGNLQTPNQELVFVGSGVEEGRRAVQLTVNIVGAIMDGSIWWSLRMPDPKKPTTMTVNDSGAIDGAVHGRGSPILGTPRSSPAPRTSRFSPPATIGPNGVLEARAQLAASTTTSPRSRTQARTTARSTFSSSATAAATS